MFASKPKQLSLFDAMIIWTNFSYPNYEDCLMFTQMDGSDAVMQLAVKFQTHPFGVYTEVVSFDPQQNEFGVRDHSH